MGFLKGKVIPVFPPLAAARLEGRSRGAGPAAPFKPEARFFIQMHIFSCC